MQEKFDVPLRFGESLTVWKFVPCRAQVMNMDGLTVENGATGGLSPECYGEISGAG